MRPGHGVARGAPGRGRSCRRQRRRASRFVVPVRRGCTRGTRRRSARRDRADPARRRRTLADHLAAASARPPSYAVASSASVKIAADPPPQLLEHRIALPVERVGAGRDRVASASEARRPSAHSRRARETVVTTRAGTLQQSRGQRSGISASISLAEPVARLGERERDVRVQALERAPGCASRRSPASSEAPAVRPGRAARELAADSRPAPRSHARGSSRQLGVCGDRRAPALDSARRLEPRHGRDEVTTRQVVGRRERLAVRPVRVLLGHGRAGPTGSGRRRAGTPAARARAGARRRPDRPRLDRSRHGAQRLFRRQSPAVGRARRVRRSRRRCP